MHFPGPGRGGGAGAVQVFAGPVRDAFEQGGRLGIFEIELHVDEAAHELLERIMVHAATAVRLHGSGPFGVQANHFLAQCGVAEGAGEPGQTAQPLAENGVAVAGAPAAERLARRGQAGRAAVAAEDVVIRDAEIKIARRLILFLPAAFAQLDAAIIKRLDFDPGGGGRRLQCRALSEPSNGVGRDRRGFQKITTGDLGVEVCFHAMKR